jgi:hypothetical protein
MGGSIFTSSDSQLLIKNSSFQRISSILSSGGVIFLSSGATIILSNSYFVAYFFLKDLILQKYIIQKFDHLMQLLRAVHFI